MPRDKIISLLKNKKRLKRGETNAVIEYLQTHKDDSEVLGLFTESNKGMIAKVASKYTNGYNADNFDDLLQEGFLGLTRAIEKYDPVKGAAFWTYAYYWIEDAIRKYAIEDQPIRLPIHTYEKYIRIKRLTDDFKKDFSVKELAKELKVSEAQVNAILNSNNRKIVSADTSLPEDPSFAPLDDSLQNVESQAELNDIQNALPSDIAYSVRNILFPWGVNFSDKERARREKKVLQITELITRHYGLSGNEPESLETIAKDMHCSKQSLSQMEKNYFLKLKEDRGFRNKYSEFANEI